MNPLDGLPKTVTLPLGPGRYALLQLPPGLLSPDEWNQLELVLIAMRPGLVVSEELSDFPVAEALAAHAREEALSA